MIDHSTLWLSCVRAPRRNCTTPPATMPKSGTGDARRETAE